MVLSRRRSGGGAVYHNLGNTCFSFLIPVYGDEPPLNAKNTNNKILIEGLAGLGLKAEVSGRNDMLLDGKKVILDIFLNFRFLKNKLISLKFLIIFNNFPRFHRFQAPPIKLISVRRMVLEKGVFIMVPC